MDPAALLLLRKSSTLTQKAFAEQLGVTPNTVARWERGEQAIPAWVDILCGKVEEVRRLEEKVAHLKAKLRQRGQGG